MASRIQQSVERLLGWLFVVIVIAVMGAALYVATQPFVDVTDIRQLN
jgi:choline-glycine betaine transporter